MPRAATRQPDLFAPPDQPPAETVFPVLTEEQKATALWLLERELAEIEAATELPCGGDTSRCMGKEMTYRGRLWQVSDDDKARLLARWNAAWERHWAKWEAETPPEPEWEYDSFTARA
jgi:hypothetical protein